MKRRFDQHRFLNKRGLKIGFLALIPVLVRYIPECFAVLIQAGVVVKGLVKGFFLIAVLFDVGQEAVIFFGKTGKSQLIQPIDQHFAFRWLDGD